MSLTISKDYIAVLKKYLMCMKSRPTKDVLFFKHNGKILISKTGNAVGFNISVLPEHMDFDKNEFALSNLEEFLKYIDAVKYLKDDAATIDFKKVTNTSGDLTLEILAMHGKGGKFYLPLANTGLFQDQFDRKPPTERTADTSQLKAKFYLNKEEISNLTKSFKLLEAHDVFGLGIENDSISMYAKGKSNQQFEKTMDPTCSKVLDSYTTADSNAKNGGCKLFSTDFINSMEYFECDFDVEFRIRINPRNNSILHLLKGYGKIEADGKSPINVYMVAQENVATAITGTFDVMK
jgi:hypothetical protein